MNEPVEEIVDQFESGQLTRRQLVGRLSVLAGLMAGTGGVLRAESANMAAPPAADPLLAHCVAAAGVTLANNVNFNTVFGTSNWPVAMGSQMAKLTIAIHGGIKPQLRNDALMVQCVATATSQLVTCKGFLDQCGNEHVADWPLAMGSEIAKVASALYESL